MKPLKFPIPRFDALAAFLNSRNAREKYMLVVFVGVFLLVLGYFVWFSPIFEIYKSAAPKVAPLRQELRSLLEDLRNKEEIHKKWEDAKKLLAEKDRLFIASDETPALLENLSKQAQRAGVKITSLEPFESKKTVSGKASYTPLPIQMKAMAGTHEFGSLLDTFSLNSSLDGQTYQLSPYGRVIYATPKGGLLTVSYTGVGPRAMPSGWDSQKQNAEQWLSIPQISASTDGLPVMETGQHIEGRWDQTWTDPVF